MAFLLIPGLLLGAAAVALTESERNYYYDTRNYNMKYLGERDGCEIWQDIRTGTFYVDDGWDVSRVGTPGFVPHPVDREHLRHLSTKYNPDNLKWTDFLLATFEGRTDRLWRNFFEKYELGPKPREPTWGKGIRKARWSSYYEQLEAWEAKKKELEPAFLEECQMWEEQKAVYNKDHAQERAASSGRAMLQRAASGQVAFQPAFARSGSGGFVISPPPPQLQLQQQYKAQIPPNCEPGSAFLVNCGGTNVLVKVPLGAKAGDELSFMGPASVQVPVAVPQVQQQQPPQQPKRAAPQVPPPPAIGSVAPPPPPAIGSAAPQAPPPPPGVAAPPPIQKKNSFLW